MNAAETPYRPAPQRIANDSLVCRPVGAILKELLLVVHGKVPAERLVARRFAPSGIVGMQPDGGALFTQQNNSAGRSLVKAPVTFRADGARGRVEPILAILFGRGHDDADAAETGVLRTIAFSLVRRFLGILVVLVANTLRPVGKKHKSGNSRS